MKPFQTVESLHREIRNKAYDYFSVASTTHIRVYEGYNGENKYVVNVTDPAGNSLGAAESFAHKDALRQTLKAMKEKAKAMDSFWANLEHSLRVTDDLSA